MHPDGQYTQLICEEYNLKNPYPFIQAHLGNAEILEFLEMQKKIGFRSLFSTSQQEELVICLQKKLQEIYETVILAASDTLRSDLGGSGFRASQMLSNLGKCIAAEIPLWLKTSGKQGTLYTPKELATWGNIRGESRQIFIAKSALIDKGGVILDSTKGPIVIDEGARIDAFSYIQGPVYIAKKVHLFQLRLIGPTTIGEGSRISGEVENSIIGKFTNKQHAGFIGHSIIGDWVNLGAMTSNSDLKNNYGNIKIDLPLLNKKKKISIDMGLKWGAIIGDWCKTAIFTSIQSGTIIDCGSNVFHPTQSPQVSSYIPPLSWGLGSGQKSYEKIRFIEDCNKIALRRKEILSPQFKYYISFFTK